MGIHIKRHKLLLYSKHYLARKEISDWLIVSARRILLIQVFYWYKLLSLLLLWNVKVKPRIAMQLKRFKPEARNLINQTKTCQPHYKQYSIYSYLDRFNMQSFWWKHLMHENVSSLINWNIHIESIEICKILFPNIFH